MTNNWNTRQTLLERAMDQNDQSAWEEFCTYYEGFILMLLRKMNCPTSDLNDVAQQVMLKTWKSLPSMQYERDKAKFRTWFSTLIRSCVMDYFRKEQRVNKKNNAAVESFDINKEMFSEPDIEALIESEWKSHVVNLAIEKIRQTHSEKSVAIFELVVKGLKTADISKELNVPANYVSIVKKRLKIKLKEEIGIIKQNTDLFG